MFPCGSASATAFAGEGSRIGVTAANNAAVFRAEDGENRGRFAARVPAPLGACLYTGAASRRHVPAVEHGLAPEHGYPVGGALVHAVAVQALVLHAVGGHPAIHLFAPKPERRTARPSTK